MAAALPWTACLFAMASATLGAAATLKRRDHVRRQRALRLQWQCAAGKAAPSSFPDRLLANLSSYNLLSQQRRATELQLPFTEAGARNLDKSMKLAGMDEVPLHIALRWRNRNSVALAALLSLAGLAFSPLAGLLGLCLGGAAGWASLSWALRHRAGFRKRQLERHLSEAVEVLCLGLRAGLSFERSLGLYCENFHTPLASDFGIAQQTWSSGLMPRHQALGNLAASYDSLVFDRIVESICRSLRFGTPMADSLAELAQESRRAHKAQVEEAVMKAPVKMMVPVGLLILPSMLLLVMGPIILELVNGF